MDNYANPTCRESGLTQTMEAPMDTGRPIRIQLEEIEAALLETREILSSIFTQLLNTPGTPQRDQKSASCLKEELDINEMLAMDIRKLSIKLQMVVFGNRNERL